MIAQTVPATIAPIITTIIVTMTMVSAEDGAEWVSAALGSEP